MRRLLELPRPQHEDHRRALPQRFFQRFDRQPLPVESPQVVGEQVQVLDDGAGLAAVGVDEGALPAAQGGVGVKVRDHQMAAGRQDGCRRRQGPIQVLDVTENQGADDEVEGGGAERQWTAGRRNQPRAGEGVRTGEHRQGEVGGDRFRRPTFQDPPADPPLAAAEIEHSASRDVRQQALKRRGFELLESIGHAAVVRRPPPIAFGGRELGPVPPGKRDQPPRPWPPLRHPASVPLAAMRLVIVNYGGDFAGTAEPKAVLDALRGLTGWAEAVRAAGVKVTVVQGAGSDARLRRAAVDYVFVAGRFAPRLSRRRIPFRLHRAVGRLEPEAVHLNGLLYAHQARFLHRLLPSGCPLVLQHHGEPPDRGLAGHLQRWGLAAADSFFFTGLETAAPWRECGLIRPRQRVFEIMEGSSRFSPRDRAASRAASGLTGDPVFLWAGNLDANKDPLTVLSGFERALDELPGARLYMAYRHHPLLGEVRRRIASSRRLRDAVELLGAIAYERMEDLFNSADFFLQGSHKEGSGFALADALACGTVPVVTDIAPFRFMTANGAAGALWPPGDAGTLASAILGLARRPPGAGPTRHRIEPQRRAARALFERRLSFETIGRQAVAAYQELLSVIPTGSSSRAQGKRSAALGD